MAITWLIERLDCVPQTPEGADYVVTAYWRANAEDDDYYATSYGTCGFPVVQGPSFTPYADLTEDQVLDWVWQNGVDKDATEANLDAQIEAQRNPPVVSPPLPWAVPAV